MRQGEAVTFGGTGRDRAYQLRGEEERLHALLQRGRILPMQDGVPLFSPWGLGWLRAGDLRPDDLRLPIFLGFMRDEAIFATPVGAGFAAATPGPGGEKANGAADPPPGRGLPPGHAFAPLRSRMAGLAADEAEVAATARALLLWHRRHGFCPNCGAPTRPAAGGWQRACTACNSEHFPRTDPAVIMLVTHGDSILLGHNVNWDAGLYSLLAGFVEPGETIEAAVRREVEEETGVICGDVTYLASQPWPFPASLMLGCRTRALSEQLTPDRIELADARWLTRAELAAAFAGENAQIRTPARGSIAEFLLAGWLGGRF